MVTALTQLSFAWENALLLIENKKLKKIQSFNNEKFIKMGCVRLLDLYVEFVLLSLKSINKPKNLKNIAHAVIKTDFIRKTSIKQHF